MPHQYKTPDLSRFSNVFNAENTTYTDLLEQFTAYLREGNNVEESMSAAATKFYLSRVEDEPQDYTLAFFLLYVMENESALEQIANNVAA